MTDRTSQPTTQVGVNSVYSSATFLWNGAVPTVNSLTGAAQVGSVRGTNKTGLDGKYQHFDNVDGAMAFAASLPTGAHTIVIVACFPTPNISGVSGLVATQINGGSGFRHEVTTTGGGVYATHTHNSVAALSQVVSSSSFDTHLWVYIKAYDGTAARQYRKAADGTIATMTGPTTIGYASPAALPQQIFLGGQDNVATHGLYAVMIVPSDIGDAECQALIANPWRMFAPVGATPVDLTAAAMSGGSMIAAGAVTYSAPSGVSLSAAAMSGGSTIATGAVTYAAPTVKVTTDAFTAWGDPTPLASLTVPHTSISALDGTFITHAANLVTDSNGRLVLQYGGLVAGTDYAVSNWDATGANRACKIYRAV